MNGQTPTTDHRGRNAILWSFFVPPLGFVFGLVLLLRLPATEPNRVVRSEAKVAAFNGVLSTLVVFKLIGLLLWLLEKTAPLR